MCEDVTFLACERIAERCPLPTVHALGGHNAKVQRCRHLQKHLELVDLRLILVGGDIKIEDAIDGFLSGGLTNAQVSRLSARGSNSAGLDTNFVKTAVFRACLSEPVGSKGRLHTTGKKQVTQRTLDTESIQNGLLILSAVVAQIGRSFSNFTSL